MCTPSYYYVSKVVGSSAVLNKEQNFVEMEVPGCPAGIYLLKVTNSESELISTQELVIE